MFNILESMDEVELDDIKPHIQARIELLDRIGYTIDSHSFTNHMSALIIGLMIAVKEGRINPTRSGEIK